MRSKLNYTEAVTVLIVILIGIIIGISVYNNEDIIVLKTVNDVKIEDTIIEDSNKTEKFEEFQNKNVISLPLRNARKLFEKNYLQSQINRFDGNISKTAAFIGMERSALHRKLKQLGITEEDRQWR